MSDKFQIELTAAQVGVLFEMCEFCTAAIGAKHRDVDSPPRAFCQVLEIQDKLDGCENLDDPSPSLCDQAGITGGPWEIQEFRAYLEEWKEAVK